MGASAGIAARFWNRLLLIQAVWARPTEAQPPPAARAGELAFDKLAQSLHRGCSHPDAKGLDGKGKGSGNCLGFAAHDKSGERGRSSQSIRACMLG